MENKPIQYFFGYTYFNNLKITLDEYVFGSQTSKKETMKWNLYKGKLKFGFQREITEKKHSLLEEKIKTIDMNYIVELGSGGGSNILYLARKFPEKKFVGIELSPTSVEHANSIKIIKFIFHIGYRWWTRRESNPRPQ